MSLLPVIIAAGIGGYAIASASKSKPSSGSSSRQNLYFVTDRQSGATVVARVQNGGAWVMVLSDAAHQTAVRNKVTALAKANPGIGFVLFSARMVVPGSLPPATWGAAEALVDRQTLGVHAFVDEDWATVLQSTLSEAINASRSLGTPLVSGLFQVTGVIG